MSSWWRIGHAKEASVEDLIKRVAKLEKQVDIGRAHILHRHVGDFDVTGQPGVYRDSLDRVIGDYNPTDDRVLTSQRLLAERMQDRVPGRVQALLEKAGLAKWGDLPLVKASSVGWRDLLTPRRVLAADGTQILNTTSETIMCPDFTFAADYFEVGDSFKYTLLFDHSTVITTPGTHTFRLRYGGVAGTVMAASGAFAPDPTAASTTVSEMLEYWFVCRATGSAGSFFTMGRYTPNDFDDASAATIVGNLNMLMIPVSAPAVVGSLDTTAAKAISPTYASSVSTATTQVTNHLAFLESLN